MKPSYWFFLAAVSFIASVGAMAAAAFFKRHKRERRERLKATAYGLLNSGRISNREIMAFLRKHGHEASYLELESAMNELVVEGKAISFEDWGSEHPIDRMANRSFIKA